MEQLAGALGELIFLGNGEEPNRYYNISNTVDR
jgi:hypothetical protein